MYQAAAQHGADSISWTVSLPWRPFHC